MDTVKPVSLEMELDFHERLLNSVGKSIASTKKRLHDAELILNLRPPDHEEAEIQEWNVKVSQLIDKRGPLQFPTLSNIQREYEKKAFIKSIRSGRQRIESDEKFNQRMSRRLAKEAEMIKKKVLSDSASFGKKVTGCAIRTIDGYDGLNTIHSGSRTLIRKEGAYVPPDPNKSSVPPWIGPQHYPDANKIPAYDLHDGQYRVPFKAAPRDATSVDVHKRQSESRRRRQINEQRQRLSLEESTVGTGSLTSFFTAFDSGPPDLKHPVHTKSALEMAKEDKLGDDSVEFDLVLRDDDEDGGSLASSVTLYSRSRTNTAHNTHHKKLTVGFLDESIEEVAAGEQSQASTPRTPASSLYSQVRSKSILHSTRVLANAPVRKKQARVPNPVYSRKDLTMKLLKLEERGNSNFFKVNDYTMNAFALHSPEVVYQEGFEAADVEAVPDESAGVYQNRSHGPFRKNKPIGTYTSDIFQVKPPEYIAHKPSATAATTADLAGQASGKLSASPSTKLNRAVSCRTQLRPLSSTKSAKTIVAAAIDRPMSRSKDIGKEPSSPDGHPAAHAYTPKLLRNDIEAEKIRCERTINKIIQRRHDSRYFDHKKALIDEASFLSVETGPGADLYSPSGQDLLDLQESLVTRRSMDKWLDEHDIIRGPIGKRVEGASFLEAHKPLPSIALSLNGLLLENNPYSLEDEFMKDLFYKPASEIGL